MSSKHPHETTCLIIGSGAGGMTTALTLARAGVRVTLVEEGCSKSTASPFSLEELRRDYRSGGQTLTIGPRPINLGEGRSLGGGTSVNTGYYLRPNSEKLQNLATTWNISEMSLDHLREDFDAIEAELRPRHQAAASWLNSQDWLRATQACSLKVESAQFIHHWNETNKTLERRSLFDLWKNEMESLGVKIVSDLKIQRLKEAGTKWMVSGVSQDGNQIQIESSVVFLCAGAIESARLLRRSGITKNVGNNLRFHLFMRVLAKFEQKVNQDRCPLFSWKSSSDLVTIGHSPDSPHLMGLAFPEMLDELKANWAHWSSFYASIPSIGCRLVRSTCKSPQPLLFSYLKAQEKRHLTEAFELLQKFLKELGVLQTYPQSPSLKFLQSVHLFGTSPMGENTSKCATNSWGQVYGLRGLYVNDASLIGTSIGQNPQATIMAIARRNSRHFLSEAKLKYV